MKYPCVEATIETPCTAGYMRLWIERPTMLTPDEQHEISKLVWSYDQQFEEFVGVLVDKIPGLSAAQLCLDTPHRMGSSVGQVVYVKDFTTDPHG